MRKLLLSILMMSVITATLAGIAKADPTTTVAVEPAQLEVDVEESHIINITVTDVSNLFLWMFRLRWNNSILQLNSLVEGPFLKQGGDTLFMQTTKNYTAINEAGKLLEVSCAIQGEVPGVSGSGVLATLNFTALAVGTSAIEFFEEPPTWTPQTMLKDPDFNTITHTPITGSIDVIPEFTSSVFAALFLLTALLIVILKKTVWSTSRKDHISVK